MCPQCTAHDICDLAAKNIPFRLKRRMPSDAVSVYNLNTFLTGDTEDLKTNTTENCLNTSKPVSIQTMTVC